jgi:hypothetical protein
MHLSWKNRCQQSSKPLESPESYSFVTLPVYLKLFVVDVVNQLPLHVIRPIRVHGLFDSITKLVRRLDVVDGAITALNIVPLVAFDAISVAIA